MGCDIHVIIEVNKEGSWIRENHKIFPEYGNNLTTEPFGWRNYGVFGFLANVRNYSNVPCIYEPKGIPKDSKQSEYFEDYHNCSWLTVKELLEFNYDIEFENLRGEGFIGPNHYSGNIPLKPGSGKKEILRDFLGESFFKHLELLKTLGESDKVRIVFGFDS